MIKRRINSVRPYTSASSPDSPVVMTLKTSSPVQSVRVVPSPVSLPPQQMSRTNTQLSPVHLSSTKIRSESMIPSRGEEQAPFRVVSPSRMVSPAQAPSRMVSPALPSRQPSQVPNAPSRQPSQAPSQAPSRMVSPALPSRQPSQAPSQAPSRMVSPALPSRQPSQAPSRMVSPALPSRQPSQAPSQVPNAPSRQPSQAPSQVPSRMVSPVQSKYRIPMRPMAASPATYRASSPIQAPSRMVSPIPMARQPIQVPSRMISPAPNAYASLERNILSKYQLEDYTSKLKSAFRSEDLLYEHLTMEDERKMALDIEELSKQEKQLETNMRELMMKFETLRRTYPTKEIPHIEITTPLEEAKTLYETTLRNIIIDANINDIRQYITLGCTGVEFIADKIFNVDISGYTEYQNKQLDSHTRLLIELGEKMYVQNGGKEASSFSPETKLAMVMAMSLGVHIMSKKMKIPEEQELIQEQIIEPDDLII